MYDDEHASHPIATHLLYELKDSKHLIINIFQKIKIQKIIKCLGIQLVFFPLLGTNEEINRTMLELYKC